MARSRSEAIADAIAKRIMANRTKKRFSTLHAEALQEIQLSDNLGTTGNIPAGLTRKGSPADGQKMVAGSTGVDNTTSDMSVSSVVPVSVKPVDRKTLEGSTPGDFNKSGDTAKASMDAIANPPSPREQMRGQQNSRNYNENGKSFVSSPGDLADSDAGN